MKTDAHFDDLCQRLQRRVDDYRNSKAGIRDFNEGRERPRHIREPKRRSRQFARCSRPN
jgi:hypothetical protein